MCDQVLQRLKSSNLNFYVQETPYSAYITIRKKFIKGRESNAESKSLSSNREDREVIENLKAKIEALEIDNTNFESDLHSLSSKEETVSNELVRVMAEKVAVEKANIAIEKALETKTVETKKLQNTVKDLSRDIQNIQNELKVSTKNLKAKEKEVQRLEKTNDNSQETSNRLKVKNSELNTENKKLKKRLAKLEKNQAAVQKETSDSNSVTPTGIPGSISSSMITNTPRHLNNPATSQVDLLHTSKETFQVSNRTSSAYSQPIPLSNLFQVLDTYSDGEQVDEDNNNPHADLQAVIEEKDAHAEPSIRKPKFMAPEQEKAFLDQFEKILKG